MRPRFAALSALTVALAPALAGCAAAGRISPAPLMAGRARLVEVAHFDHQWTGVAVAHDGRIFVNFPRWKDFPGFSVAQLRKDSTGDLVPVPYPDADWQHWQPGDDPKTHFVCVQAVYVDPQDNLWVVDAAAPNMGDIVPGGPKLVKIDLRTNRVAATYFYDQPAITQKSYLNDVRIDPARQLAYLTDSGTGAIIVTDLRTGKNHRVLGGDPSTRSEGIDVVINGKPWRRDGQKPSVNSDGIALSTDGQWLYYHALTGRTLYRIKTQHLADPAYPADELPRDIQPLGNTGVCDGMLYDGDGRILLADPERHAIMRYLPAGAGGKLQTVIQSDQLQWPDTFSVGPDGALYVSISQIDTQPHPPGPYKLFKVLPKR